MDSKKWEVVGKLQKSKTQKLQVENIVAILLKNRGIRTKKEKEEFFSPALPQELATRALGIKTTEVNKTISRIKKSILKKEKVIVFGDYDADGVCATAILWESLYELGLDVLPYIPDRFEEGYGLKAESLEKLKTQNPELKLIITVDNGIVANSAVDVANKLGIDVIITDHHQAGNSLPKAYSIIHTTEIGGAAIAWILAREVLKKMEKGRRLASGSERETSGSEGNWQLKIRKSLDLCAIGTIADQLPLIGPNRSFAKFGLERMNQTQRLGLLELFKEAGVQKGNLGSHDVNFVIGPRINAMGRLEHAIDSLRLLCTKDKEKARSLARLLGKTNYKRKKIVNKVVTHATSSLENIVTSGVIILHHEIYHEGVIGLAASKLVDTFNRPAIVISKGERYSKASARSIPGFNMIKTIRMLDDLLLDGGGHPMAAGFTIETKNLEKFKRKLNKAASSLLTSNVLEKRLKVDIELDFSFLNNKLAEEAKKLEPFGIGNPKPAYVASGVNVLNVRTVGVKGNHLKMILEQSDKVFDAIAFGFGDFFIKLSPKSQVDLVFSLEENVWNGRRSLQLLVKDIKLSN